MLDVVPAASPDPRSSRRFRVHDEHWSVYVLTGLAGLCAAASSVLRALDDGGWLLWVLAVLGGLLVTASAGALVVVGRRRGRRSTRN